MKSAPFYSKTTHKAKFCSQTMPFEIHNKMSKQKLVFEKNDSSEFVGMIVNFESIESSLYLCIHTDIEIYLVIMIRIGMKRLNHINGHTFSRIS